MLYVIYFHPQRKKIVYLNNYIIYFMERKLHHSNRVVLKYVLVHKHISSHLHKESSSELPQGLT